MTHVCVSELTIIGSDNGLSPGRRQAIIWTNAGILLSGPLGTNFNGTSIEIHTFSLKKIHLKLSSGKWRPFCLGLNVLRMWIIISTWIDTVVTPGSLFPYHKAQNPRMNCLSRLWLVAYGLIQNLTGNRLALIDQIAYFYTIVYSIFYVYTDSPYRLGRKGNTHLLPP